jgi:putative copper resistance protein D
LLYTERDETRPYAIATLIRFSTCGHVAVALVILTGILNSAIILQRLPTDLSSRYIQLLLVKIALVMVMTGVAIFNRYRLVPLIPTQPQLAYQRLASATKLELVLSLVVMLLVSWFATLSPF